MRTVKVSADKLITIVRANRDAHVNNHAEAMQAYDAKYRERLNEMLEKATNVGKFAFVDKEYEQHVGLPVPQSHTKDYDMVIKMLDMSVDSTIELTHEEFRQYVEDDWNWKQLFETVNAVYGVKKFKG